MVILQHVKCIVIDCFYQFQVFVQGSASGSSMEDIMRLTGRRETEVWLGAVATDRETKTERGKERKKERKK